MRGRNIDGKRQGIEEMGSDCGVSAEGTFC